jgi:hypothetical protein
MDPEFEQAIYRMRVQALIYGVREVAITDPHYRQMVTRSAVDFLNGGLAQDDPDPSIKIAQDQIKAGDLTFDDGTATSAGLPLADLPGIRVAFENTLGATSSDQDTSMQDVDDGSDAETPEGTSFTMPTHDGKTRSLTPYTVANIARPRFSSHRRWQFSRTRPHSERLCSCYTHLCLCTVYLCTQRSRNKISWPRHYRHHCCIQQPPSRHCCIFGQHLSGSSYWYS